MSDIVLSVKDLTKSYKKHVILNGVNMTVYKGDIYGFVGRNGAGKTTLIRVISGLVPFDGGEFSLFGVSSRNGKINEARKRTCAMVESPSIYPELTAIDNMKAQCMILKKPFSVIKDILEYVGLAETGKKKAGDFSLGMRQRLYIAMALLGEPELMLLDEPINGLDPEGIKQVRDLLYKLNKEKGITILISSHILTELSLLATTYGFIDGGKVLKEVTREEIEKATQNKAVLLVDKITESLNCLHKLNYEAYEEDGKIYTESDIDIMKVCEMFKNAGIYLNHFENSGIELEDYFIKLIGGNR